MYCYHCMKQISDEELFCQHCGEKTETENISHHIRPGTVLQNKYLVGNFIGEGGFGITYVGLDINLQLKIAIKEFFPNGYANRNNQVTNNVMLNLRKEGEYFKNGKEQFLREAQSLAKFSKENGIVDVRDYFTENDTAYIIMEYIDGLTLKDIIKQKGLISASEMFSLTLPIMHTLERMHEENIIHRDISPDNIKVTDDGSLKLMDFGSARYFSGNQKKTMSVMLKPGFAPYEQYSSEGKQGPWTDVYGLCATIYKCITGYTPSDSLNRALHDTLKKPVDLGVSISDSLQKVLMYGLAVYPENRCPDMTQLIKLTEAALHNEQVPVKNNSSTDDNIESARKSDEQYKTMFADATYGDFYNNQLTGGDPNYQQASVVSQQNQKYNTMSKKKNANLMVTLIVVLVLVVTTVAASGAFFILNNKNKDNNTETSNLAAKDTKNDEKSKADEEQESSRNNENSKSDEEEKTIKENASSKSDEEEKSLKDDESSEADEKQESEQSEEEEKVNMPDVSGKKLTDAKSELENLGLNVETQYEESTEVAEEYVIRQSIQSERKLNKGDTVMLFVAKQPEISVKTEQSSKNIENATHFSGASASSVLPDQLEYNYSPWNVLYDNSDCWVENASGLGIGEWIRLDLPERQYLNGLRIINGYAGTERQYSYNSKITKLRIDFSDGKSTTVSLNVFPTSERRTVQVISLNQPVVTEYVKLTILDAEAGECPDTCLTFVSPF